MKSYDCGAKIQYQFCDDSVDGCYWGGGTSGAGRARNPNMGTHSKKTNVVEFTHYDPAVQGAMNLFQDRWCQGQQAYFYAYPTPGQTAYYD